MCPHGKYLRRLTLFLFLIASFKSSFATHIVGGDLVYQYLGGNQYRIKLTVYRDCFNGVPDFDKPAYLGIFDSSGAVLQTISLIYKGKKNVVPNTGSACLTLPSTGICYEVTTYDTVLTLPPKPGGYQLLYQRCCRNNTILNIQNPGNTGASYYASIPDANKYGFDSNPVFKYNAPTFICAGEPFSFDHSATDADGDSLIYSICTPYDGASSSNPQPATPSLPLTYVNFAPPYSAANIMNTNPPLTINPKTGIITVKPIIQGQFVLAVCVSEYRNGKYIGQTKRDIQVNVRSCSKLVVSSIQSISTVCGSKKTSLSNNSTGAARYLWDFGDPASGAGDTSTQTNPSHIFIDFGTYTVRLIAYSSVNPSCADTSYNTIQLIAPNKPDFSYISNNCSNTAVSFSNQTNEIAPYTYTYSWNFGDGGSSTIKNPSHNYASTGTYTVRLIASASSGCSDTIVKIINLSLLNPVNAGPDQTICFGNSTTIGVTGSAGFTYSWQPTKGLNNPNIADPTASPITSTTYIVVGTSTANGCQLRDTVVVTVAGAKQAGPAKTICYGNSTGIGTNPLAGFTYTWSPATGLNNSTISNPTASPSITTTYILTASIASTGCVVKDTMVIVVSGSKQTEPAKSICYGTSYKGIVIHQDTSYSKLYTNTNGCDSTVTYTIIVNPTYSRIISASVCRSTLYQGLTINKDTSFTRHYTATNSCDSVITYNVKALWASATKVNANVCFGKSHNGVVIHQDTTYNKLFTNAQGCDSTVTYTITVKPTYMNSININVCRGSLYQGLVINTDTSFMRHYAAANACDSVVTYHVKALWASASKINANVCKNTNYNGIIIHQDTTYNTLFTNAKDCDSTVIYTITVLKTSINSLNVNICKGNTYMGIVINADTSFNRSYSAVNSCDSTVSYFVHMLPTYNVSVNANICRGTSYKGFIIYSDTTVIQHLFTSNNCDSIVTNIVKVLSKATSNVSTSICKGNIYMGLAINADTSFNRIYIGGNGCDSTVNYVVQMLPTYTVFINASICKGNSYKDFTIYTDTTIVQHLFTSNNCDSTVTNIVKVLNNPNSNVKASICEGNAYMGVTINTDTSFSRQYKGINGCDSAVKYKVAVLKKAQSHITASACKGSLYNGIVITTDTSFNQIYTATNGCDSTVIYKVHAIPIFETLLNINICKGSVYQDITIGNDTAIITKYISSSGCDSIVTHQITTLQPVYNSINTKVCTGTIYNGLLILQDTTFNKQYTAGNGCDSTVKYSIKALHNSKNRILTGICKGSLFQNIVINGDTSFSKTFSNAADCDSVVTYKIIALNKSYNTVKTSICKGSMYEGIIISNDTTFTRTVIASNGCDSIITYHIHVLPFKTGITTATICKGTVLYGLNINNDTTIVKLLRAANGCDSSLSIRVSVIQPIHITKNIEACIGTVFKGHLINKDFSFPDNIKSVLTGCDSVVTYNIHVSFPTIETRQVSICRGALYLNYHIYSDSTINERYTTSKGCDSTIIHHISIIPSITYTKDTLVCHGTKIKGLTINQDTTLTSHFKAYTGCDSTLVFMIKVIKYDVYSLPNSGFCAGSSVKLIIKGGYNYTWTPSAGLSCSNCNNPVASPNETISYAVGFTGCDNKTHTTTVIVYVYPTPMVDITKEIINGKYTSLTANGKGYGYLQYTWISNDITLCDSCQTLDIRNRQSTIYTVRITDGHNCRNQRSVFIPNTPAIFDTTKSSGAIVKAETLDCADALNSLPNIITPNGDGINDYFYLKDNDISLEILRIFDRWGELMFETSSINRRWDGSYRNQPCNPGVYTYYVQGHCKYSEKPFLKSGNVTLIK